MNPYPTHDAAKHISQQTLADMAAAHGCAVGGQRGGGGMSNE